MSISSKYLRDETGEVINPITSTSSVYDLANNPLSYNDAFYTSTLVPREESYITDQIINFTSNDYSKNITLSGGKFTIVYSGVYMVTTSFHLYNSSGHVGRCFPVVHTSNNSDSSKACFNNAWRGTDIYAIYSGGTGNDPNIRDTFILRMIASGKIYVTLTAVSISSVTIFGGSESANDASSIVIQRIGSL